MKKKVLIISDAKSIGGAEIYIKNLLKLFKNEEYEFKVYGNPILKNVIPNAIACKFENRKPLRTIINFLIILWKEKPDLIHLNLTYPASCIWIQIISLFFRNILFIGTLHLATSVKRKKIIKLILMKTFNKINLILVSFSAKKELFENYGINIESNNIIPNWVDIDFYTVPDLNRKNELKSKMGLKSNTKVGLFVGRLEEQKNVLELVELFNTLVSSEDNWHFYIVGEGSQEYDIKSKIKKMELEDKVNVQSFTDNIKPYYQMSDVLFLLSKNECAPLTLLESMASGVSPVVSNVGDMKLMVSDPNVVYEREKRSDSNFIDVVEYSIKKGPQFWRNIVESNFSPLFALNKMKKVYKSKN
ncbi:glycosyltransferase [Heyndrickxia coagulans]|uniref:glycosyltransferase n=1 Tax=Heyndrickxia coagulans TaxID=1398 RepID=UPI000E50D7CC|nr:glycosyltransferase [Heyndrickxia coagulans]RGR83285.1 glycosyltransferase [Heyndrickxia coagulans]